MPFSEVVVLEGLAVSGGYLKEPVWVPSLEFEGLMFLRLRQYDDWIHKLVCNQSRRASPLAQCGLWQKLLAASCGADALPVDDPLADIMKTTEDPSLEPAKKRPRPRQWAVRQTEFWQDHQKSQRRVRRIEYQGDAGSSDKQSFTILQHVQHCRCAFDAFPVSLPPLHLPLPSLPPLDPPLLPPLPGVGVCFVLPAATAGVAGGTGQS